MSANLTPEISSCPTNLIHLTYDGNFQLNCEASLISCKFVEGEKDDETDKMKVEIQLDTTTMHPQGGGQPSDLGTISTPSMTFQIERVVLDRATGIVTHHGTISKAAKPDLNIAPGTTVQVKVDLDNRKILSECHTGGHIVDAAMDRCGYTLQAKKGYHFLDGPYVEYKGKLPADKSKEEIIAGLQEAFQQLLEEDIRTEIETYPKAEADALCNRLAQNFDFSHYGEEVRIVTVGGCPCPCGGTHVQTTADLKERGWNVKGLRSKKGVVRVRYGFDKE